MSLLSYLYLCLFLACLLFHVCVFLMSCHGLSASCLSLVHMSPEQKVTVFLYVPFRIRILVFYVSLYGLVRLCPESYKKSHRLCMSRSVFVIVILSLSLYVYVSLSFACMDFRLCHYVICLSLFSLSLFSLVLYQRKP